MNALLEMVKGAQEHGAIVKRWGWSLDGVTPWIEFSGTVWAEKPQNSALWELHHSEQPRPKTFVSLLTLVEALDRRYRQKKAKKSCKSGPAVVKLIYEATTARKKTRKNMSKELNISSACSSLLTKLGRTRNLRALGLLVKAGIRQRDLIAGREVEACEYDYSKCGDSKGRKRTEVMIAEVEALTEKKDVSVFCARAIAQRKAVRADRAES